MKVLKLFLDFKDFRNEHLILKSIPKVRKLSLFSKLYFHQILIKQIT